MRPTSGISPAATHNAATSTSGGTPASAGSTFTESAPMSGVSPIRPLPSPKELRLDIELGGDACRLVESSRHTIANIIHGRDHRILVIVGPCSIHDRDAACDYAARLAEQARRYSDRLFIVMRVYGEKPRTTVGWKGLVNDPDLDGSGDITRGLALEREVFRDVLSLGLPTATEFVEPLATSYIHDAVSWGAIGARTVESQVHRQLASSLPMPIGFKNATDGSIQQAIDESGPNYGTESVLTAADRLTAAGLHPAVTIDASHGNSGKDHIRQRVVVANIAERIAEGEPGINGVMMESFLLPGKQTHDEDMIRRYGKKALTYGQSITDACMGWDATVSALDELARAVRTRGHGA